VLRIAWAVLVAAILYLVPGIVALQLIELRQVGRPIRLLLGLCGSIVLLPCAFVLVGNIAPFRPGLGPWFVLVAGLAGAAWFLRRWRRRPVVLLKTGYGGPATVGPLEKAAACVLLTLFAAFVNLPRLAMFLQGEQALTVSPWDETWHLAQLVAVARTGIPPHHYFFPSINLAYYYASWIYPAVLGNLPLAPVSLIRAMSIHAFLSTLVFLGLAYMLLCLNFSDWRVRWAGISFFTVMGGFDVFAAMPGIDQIDWWQRQAGWLTNGFQVSQFATLYAWVPQHVAAGAAFLVLLILWRNADAQFSLKLIASAVLLAFSFVTSPFVFLASALAFGFVGMFDWRRTWASLRSAKWPLGVVLALFLLVTWYPLLIAVRHQGTLSWNGFRVPVLERLWRETASTAIADRILTLLGFPLVASWIGLIEMGLPFVLYLVWWGNRFVSRQWMLASRQDALLGLFPPFYMLLVFLIKDQGGGGNLSMRGLIPAQVLVVLAGLEALQTLLDRVRGVGWRKWVLAYLFLVLLLAQGFSTLAEIRTVASDALKLVLRSDCVRSGVLTGAYENCRPQDQLQYVYWLNENTPANALILETGPAPTDAPKYRWLERSRLLTSGFATGLQLFQEDSGFILPDEWDRLRDQMSTTDDVLEWYQGLDFRYKATSPVYVVVWEGGATPALTSAPVYRDAYLAIYRLE